MRRWLQSRLVLARTRTLNLAAVDRWKTNRIAAAFPPLESYSRPIMANVDRAYNLVRQELAELGLLSDGIYLDAVELCISNAKSAGERGYVFEQVGHYGKRGYRPGVIYLPRDLPHQPYKPGMTLCDTIRHEYAHAWYYIDSAFFKEPWFKRTFGSAYEDCTSTPYQSWRRHLKRDPEYQAGKSRRKTDQGRLKFFYGCLFQQFITDYASTNSSEDFAETFMFFVKYRNSLSRFRNRPVVYHKLKMVERAVAVAGRKVKIMAERSYRSRTA